MSEMSIRSDPSVASAFQSHIENHLTHGMGGRGATQPEVRIIPKDTHGELIESREQVLSIKSITQTPPNPLFDGQGDPIFEAAASQHLTIQVGQIMGFET